MNPGFPTSTAHETGNHAHVNVPQSFSSSAKTDNYIHFDSNGNSSPTGGEALSSSNHNVHSYHSPLTELIRFDDTFRDQEFNQSNQSNKYILTSSGTLGGASVGGQLVAPPTVDSLAGQSVGANLSSDLGGFPLDFNNDNHQLQSTSKTTLIRPQSGNLTPTLRACDDVGLDGSATSNVHLSSTTNSTGKKDTEGAAAASSSSHVGNVYVANLRTTTDATKIRHHFQVFGRVLHVKLLLDIATGVSRCIAFVMFAEFADALQACALANKTELDGSVIQVRMAQRGNAVGPDSHVYTPTVFLRNVPSMTLRKDVKAHCETNFGPIKNIALHPQSHELNGPSPFNMMVIEFMDAHQASLFVEKTDGRANFPVTDGHPLLMAKMITNPAAEMRKSILLRPTTSRPPPPPAPPTKRMTDITTGSISGGGGAMSIVGTSVLGPMSAFSNGPSFTPYQQGHTLPSDQSSQSISALFLPQQNQTIASPTNAMHIISPQQQPQYNALPRLAAGDQAQLIAPSLQQLPMWGSGAGGSSAVSQGGLFLSPQSIQHQQQQHQSLQFRLPNGEIVLMPAQSYYNNQQQQQPSAMPYPPYAALNQPHFVSASPHLHHAVFSAPPHANSGRGSNQPLYGNPQYGGDSSRLTGQTPSPSPSLAPPPPPPHYNSLHIPQHQIEQQRPNRRQR